MGQLQALPFTSVLNWRVRFKETLINWLYERIASMRGTCCFAYHVDMSRLLRSVRPVPHLVRRFNQRFLSFLRH